jgi:hypothetical protein
MMICSLSFVRGQIPSERFAALNDSDQHNNDCDDEENMDKAANGMAADQAQKP